MLLIALWGILWEGISLSPLLIALTVFMMVSLFIPQIAGWLPRKWMGAFSTVLIIGVGIDLTISLATAIGTNIARRCPRSLDPHYLLPNFPGIDAITIARSVSDHVNRSDECVHQLCGAARPVHAAGNDPADAQHHPGSGSA